MKRLLKKFAIFLIGLFLITLIIQSLIFAIIKKINIGDYGLMNAIDSSKINAAALICGSSRAYVQYNPEIIAKKIGLSCYNIGINGSGLEVQTAVLKWYLAKNVPPQLLIQNIDLFGGEMDSVIFAPYRFIPYLKDDILFHELSRVNPKLWLNKYIPIANFVYFNKDFQKNLILDLLRYIKNGPDYLNHGFSARADKTIDEKYEAVFLREHAEGFFYSISQEINDYLLELIDLCQKHTIQLVFVVAPEYIKFQALQRNRQDIIDYYHRVCRENGVLFVDYSQSRICQNKEFFYNYSHLNSNGADEFSNDLADKIKKILAQ